MGSCCGSLGAGAEASIDTQKIDELVKAVGRLDEANDEIRSLLRAPLTKELRQERLELEQVLLRQWPLPIDELHLGRPAHSATPSRETGC